MYKWILIILTVSLFSLSAFSDITTPISGDGGADADSLKGVPLQDTTGNLSDDDVMRYDSGTNTWLYEAPPGAAGGEANTLADTGTFNGTEGFGLAGGKTGTALKVKGLIEGTGTVITASGDSAYSIAPTLGTAVDGSELDTGLKDSITTGFDHAGDNTQAHSDYMRNVGDTVTGTYNFSDNPLEAVTIIDFDDNISTPAHQEGRIFYEPTDNTLSVYNNEADITLNVGQEGWVYARNISGSTILDGKVVYITGAVSSRPTIQLAQADVEATCKLIGVATHDIETASNGYVTLWGTVHGIDLSNFSDGDEVYLSATVAGSLTTTAPAAPSCVVEVGHVIDGSVNGDLLVITGKLKTFNMLSDVLISGSPPSSGDILVYDGSVWADTAVLQNYLPLSGGTMGGDINMNQNAILDGRYLELDTLVIDHDTSYAEHIIAYLVRLDVHNASGATLEEDTPVYISGATGDIPNIDSARADNAAMMPAIGIVEHDIANGGDGHIIVSGQYGPFNTSAWSVQDPLYVEATGGLTNTKPTGTNLIQRIGTVTRDNPSQGDIQIVGAGRSNDIPNIASANFWLGNGSGVPTAVTMSSDATMDNAGAVTVTDDSHNHVITNIDVFSKANLETQTSDVADYAEADGDTWTGSHDFGGATSLEIPNSDNPTTDANGEIAQDNNGNAIEVYILSESESGLIPFYRYISIPIVLPDSVQAQTPDLKVFHVKEMLFPYGIEIDSVEIQLDADAVYSLVVEEWSGADPPVFQSTITTIATGGTDTYAIEAPDTDAAIDANDWIVLDLPTTDVPFLGVGIYYHITEGN